MRVETMRILDTQLPGRPIIQESSNAATLLPPPPPGASPTKGAETFGSFGDPIGALYAMMTKRGETDFKDGRTGTLVKKTEKMEELKKQADASRKAQEERDAQHGLWGTLKKVAVVVAEVAGTVASAAALVVTGGAAAPLIIGIAALVLSTGGAVISATGCLGKSSKWVGLGMEAAGLVAGCGGAIFGLGASAGSAAATAGTATNAASATTKAATTGASALTTFASTTRTTALVTQGAALGAEGTSTMVIAGHESNEEHASADSIDAQQKAALAQRQLMGLLEWMKGMQEENQSTLETIQGAQSTNAKTNLSLTMMGGRA